MSCESAHKLSMLSQYTLYHPPSKFCEYACHCELCLYLIVLGCLDINVSLFYYFLIKRMLDDILFELTLMSCDSV